MHFVDGSMGGAREDWGGAGSPRNQTQTATTRPAGRSRSGLLRATQSVRPSVRFAHTLSRHGRAAASTGRSRPNVLFGLRQSSRLFYSSKGTFSFLWRQHIQLAMSRRDTFLKHVMTSGPTRVRPRPRPPSGTYTRAPPSHLITASRGRITRSTDLGLICRQNKFYK